MKKNETVQSLYYLSKTKYNESILGGYPIFIFVIYLEILKLTKTLVIQFY